MRSTLRLACLLFVTIGGTLSAATYVVPPDEILIARADAIVIARALHSRAEASKRAGIETVTVFALDETLKSDGAVAGGFRVRVPGGRLQETGKPAMVKLIQGAPRFSEGKQVLLFLIRGEGGDYFIADFALGSFAFSTDDRGRSVIIRSSTEVRGWNLDGTPYREPRRDAQQFLRFIRDVIHDRPANQDYEIQPPSQPSSDTGARLRETLMDCAGCGARQYSSASLEAGDGARWKTFPVSWNRGNGMSNAPNDGADSITNAFSTWKTGSDVNYELSGSTANTNGIYQAPDGVNNIVFEKDMYANGVLEYSCAYGGMLGVAGVQISIADDSNVIDSSLFFRTIEADVSMNKGINACLGFYLPVAEFNSAVAHEVGHTLGFRHADRSRDDSLACTEYATYDCASSAIMTEVVTSGLNGMLAAWDQRAVAALYPPGSSIFPPANVVASATSATSINVTWSASAGAASYQIFRSSGGLYELAGTSMTTAFTDSVPFSDASYLYRVRAVTSGGYLSGDSAADYATAFVFGDAPLAAGMNIRFLHVGQLRMTVNYLRQLAGLSAFTFTDPSVTLGVTPMKAAHISELRSAVNEARTVLGFSSLSFTDAALSGTVIKAVHIHELRAAVQ